MIRRRPRERRDQEISLFTGGSLRSLEATGHDIGLEMVKEFMKRALPQSSLYSTLGYGKDRHCVPLNDSRFAINEEKYL